MYQFGSQYVGPEELGMYISATDLLLTVDIVMVYCVSIQASPLLFRELV